MSKLTHDDMFLILDAVSDFLENNIGQEYVYKREPGKITIEMKHRLSGYLPVTGVVHNKPVGTMCV